MDTFFYHVLPVVTCILLGILVWIIIQWKKSAKRGAMPFCTSCSGHTDCSTTSQKKCLEKRQWYKEWGLFIKWSTGVVFCCALFWVLMWLWFRTSTPVGNESEAKTWVEAGTFGDMFGFLTCLFSGLAFSGIIISIRQQNHNLELQREAINLQCQEMKDTRAEFEAQTAQLLAQAQIAKEQRMDAACFEYLKYLESRKQAIVEEKEPPAVKEVPFDCFREWYISQAKRQTSDLAKTLREYGTWYRIVMSWIDRVVTAFPNDKELQKKYVDNLLLSLSINEQRCLKCYSHSADDAFYNTSDDREIMDAVSNCSAQLRPFLKRNKNKKLIIEILKNFFNNNSVKVQ